MCIALCKLCDNLQIHEDGKVLADMSKYGDFNRYKVKGSKYQYTQVNDNFIWAE